MFEVHFYEKTRNNKSKKTSKPKHPNIQTQNNIIIKIRKVEAKPAIENAHQTQNNIFIKIGNKTNKQHNKRNDEKKKKESKCKKREIESVYATRENNQTQDTPMDEMATNKN